MKRVITLIYVLAVIVGTLFAQGYKNPVLPGFHADFDWFEYKTE